MTSSIGRQPPADDIPEIVSPGAAAIIAEASETSLEASVKRRYEFAGCITADEPERVAF